MKKFEKYMWITTALFCFSWWFFQTPVGLVVLALFLLALPWLALAWLFDFTYSD